MNGVLKIRLHFWTMNLPERKELLTFFDVKCDRQIF